MTMELPIQRSTELPVGARGTNVDGHLTTTIGLQSATLLHPIKASPPIGQTGLAPTLLQPLLQSIKMPPPITTCVSLVTAGQTKIPSQLPGMVPSSLILCYLLCHIILRYLLYPCPVREGGLSLVYIWTPQTVSYSARPMGQTPQTNPILMRTAPLVSLAEPPVAPLPTLLTEQCRGKAPPIDSFNGEDSEIWFDDWIPTLERASSWNGWTEDERLVQSAGHLRGKALQKWNLIPPAECQTYQSSTAALRMCLDHGNKTLADLDFRHITQKETESVSDFIRRLECTFQIAFGRDPMSAETGDVLLNGKLQDDLQIDLVSRAPAISGAQNYQELCIAAKNEERRLAELKS